MYKLYSRKGLINSDLIYYLRLNNKDRNNIITVTYYVRINNLRFIFLKDINNCNYERINNIHVTFSLFRPLDYREVKELLCFFNRQKKTTFDNDTELIIEDITTILLCW